MCVAVDIAADVEGFDDVDEIAALETKVVVALSCASIAYLELVHCSSFDSYSHSCCLVENSHFCYSQQLLVVV